MKKGDLIIIKRNKLSNSRYIRCIHNCMYSKHFNNVWDMAPTSLSEHTQGMIFIKETSVSVFIRRIVYQFAPGRKISCVDMLNIYIKKTGGKRWITL